MFESCVYMTKVAPKRVGLGSDPRCRRFQLIYVSALTYIVEHNSQNQRWVPERI